MTGRDLELASRDAAVRERFAALAAARQTEQEALHDDNDPWARADALAGQWLRQAFADGTRGQYRGVWDAWRTWLVMTGIDPFAALRSDVDAYALALAKVGNPAARRPRPLSRTTIARHLSSISSFYTRGVEDELTDRNPVPRRRATQVRQDSKQPYLAVDQIRAIIAAADGHSDRASALVALLLLVCVRTSESLSVRVEQIRYEGGHRFIHVTKKGGIRARTAIPPQAWDRITRAIGDRREGPIICGRKGQPIARKTAWQLVGRIGRLAGVEARIGGHTLRHAALTRGHELSIPLADLQDLAAHADPKTTRHYDRSPFDPSRHAAFKIAADLVGTPNAEEEVAS